ncbi:MAG TPA: hypothetical protein EYP71_01710 [Dehalococcoidia bacterium]|nr:hypothetical protein [Dehalococcoidia bacterium]
MGSSRRCWLLLSGLIILLVSLFAACGKPSGYVTYTDEDWGYAISYPYNWQIELTEDAQICVVKSPSGRASVQVYVTEKPMIAQDAANRWLMALGTAHHEVTVFDNGPRDSFWDWYLSYDYETDYGVFHGEAYFKQTSAHLYKVDTAADKNRYDFYPFETIISTFKVFRK